MQASHPQRSRSADLVEHFNAVRAYTEKLCEPLEVEEDDKEGAASVAYSVTGDIAL